MATLMYLYSPQPVWYSVFCYIGNNSYYYYQDPTTHKPIGAAHHDDTIYTFSGSFHQALAAAARGKITSWDPNPPKGELPQLSTMHWPAMKPEDMDRKYLKVDKDFAVHEKLHELRLQVCDEL